MTRPRWWKLTCRECGASQELPEPLPCRVKCTGCDRKLPIIHPPQDVDALIVELDAISSQGGS